MSSIKNIVIFIGPPGSGKGSISYLCIKKLGWEQLSTGNLCRNHIARKTSIGQKIDFAIKSGKLIEDSLIVDMVKEFFAGDGIFLKPIILDGFPRTLSQAKSLALLLKEVSSEYVIRVVRLNVSRQTVIKRLMARTICPNEACLAVYSNLTDCKLECDSCGAALVSRSDDTCEAVERRLKLYYENELDLVDFYKNKNQFAGEINVEKPLEDVFVDFLALLPGLDRAV